MNRPLYTTTNVLTDQELSSILTGLAKKVRWEQQQVAMSSRVHEYAAAESAAAAVSCLASWTTAAHTSCWPTRHADVCMCISWKSGIILAVMLVLGTVALALEVWPWPKIEGQSLGRLQNSQLTSIDWSMRDWSELYFKILGPYLLIVGNRGLVRVLEKKTGFHYFLS